MNEWKRLIERYKLERCVLRVDLKTEKVAFFGTVEDITDTHFILKNDRASKEHVIIYDEIKVIGSTFIEE